MRKAFFLFIALILTLTACSNDDLERQEIVKGFSEASYLQMTAEICCEYENEQRSYTLSCHYVPEGLSVVSVVEPEELLGLVAEFEGKEKRLSYQDTVLDAPLLGMNGISPASLLPLLCDAIRDGYIIEESAEDCKDIPAWRITFLEEGEQESLYYTVWFAKEDGRPLAAELTEGTVLNFKLAFTDFIFGDILTK